MSLFFDILLACLAALGLTLSVREQINRSRAKKATFVCLCFDEKLLNGGSPDMLIICKSDAEQEEIIKRICDKESRKVFIKRW